MASQTARARFCGLTIVEIILIPPRMPPLDADRTTIAPDLESIETLLTGSSAKRVQTVSGNRFVLSAHV